MSEKKPFDDVMGRDSIDIGEEAGKNVPFFESLMPGGLEGVPDEVGPPKGT